MSRVRLATAGESHGPCEVCLIEGIPAGLSIEAKDIDVDLARRQQGYGRGGRMAIESDRCEIIGGVRLGSTLGSPIAIVVRNEDHANWAAEMAVSRASRGERDASEQSSVPRPGHADFAGMVKFGYDTIRPVLERASARETVGRVAGGSICKKLLAELGVMVRARVVSIGAVAADCSGTDYCDARSVDWKAADASVMGCDDASATEAMCRAVDEAREQGESLGGIFEVWAWGLCPGLGSHVTYHERLDGLLLVAIGSIPAVKGAEIGDAFANASRRGSVVHDAFARGGRGGVSAFSRATNRAGGLEGGMTNGMPVVLRAAMKPIPTMTTPLPSIDVVTLRPAVADYERSDITAVPAARVVGEAMVAYVLAGAYVDKFGGDSLQELRRTVDAYEAGLKEQGLWRRS